MAEFFRRYSTPEETIIVWQRQLNFIFNNLGTVIASGTKQAAISDPALGATIDAQARTAINSIIDALQAFDIVST